MSLVGDERLVWEHVDDARSSFKVPSVQKHDIVEFAYDWFVDRAHFAPKRMYLLVTESTPDHITGVQLDAFDQAPEGPPDGVPTIAL